MNLKNLFFIVVIFLNGTILSAAVHKDPCQNQLFVAMDDNFKLHMKSHVGEDHQPIAFVIQPREEIDTTQLTTQDFENLLATIFIAEECPFLRVVSFKNCNLTVNAYQTLLAYLGRYCRSLQYIDLRGNPKISLFYAGKQKLNGTDFTGASVFYTLIQTDADLDTAIAQASEHDLFESMQQ